VSSMEREPTAEEREKIGSATGVQKGDPVIAYSFYVIARLAHARGALRIVEQSNISNTKVLVDLYLGMIDSAANTVL
jgi:hypothetical protein